MKKIFTLLSAAVLGCFGAMATTATWNFSTWTAETFAKTKTIEGLTVYSLAGVEQEDGTTKDFTVAIDDNNKTIDGTKYTQRLKFGGATGWNADGKPYYRALSFEVDGASKVEVAMCSSSSSGNGRFLNVYNATKANPLTADGIEATTGNPVVETFEYTGTEATTLVIGVSAGINVYFVRVSPAEAGGEDPGEDPVVPTPGEDVATGIVLSADSFSNIGDKPEKLIGAGDAEGFTLAMAGKTFSGASKITVDGKAYTSIKSSNGVLCTLTLPAGLVATKMTIYSYVNKEAIEKDCFWTVNGVTNNDKLVSAKDYANPDVRTFVLDNANVIEFKQSGTQCCFVLALDVTDPSGIESVATDNAAAVYYNMQGVRVENPVQGNLYIRVAGGKATKVLVK